MTQRTVRLSDVAAAAGTSTKTVSRVINGDPRVATETRKRIQEHVDLLGYRVDVMARSLRRGVDETVGVIVPTIGDPFFAAMIEEIERIALEEELKVFIASNSRNTGTERAVVEGMLARRVAGLIVAPFMTDYGFLTNIKTPVTFLDRHPLGLEADVVLVDDFAEAQKAVHHLASHGHTRIALVVDNLEIETSRLRRNGYLAAHRELDLEIDQSLQFFDCADAEAAEQEIRQMLLREDIPTAIFSTRSETSLGVVRALHLGGRTDIAMVSFGDFVAADILKPSITVLDHDPRVLARLAMERLVELMRNGGPREPREIVVPLHLIPRGSGEISPPLLEGIA